MSDDFQRKMDKQIHLILNQRCNEQEKRISELEASSASHTENKEGLRKLEMGYDQLSNWSVGIDLHIGELEKNCEVSFAKVEDHIERILKVIDIQTQSTEMLTEQIAELREQVDRIASGNAELRGEIERLRTTPGAVEEARSQGWVEPGERPILFTDDPPQSE